MLHAPAKQGQPDSRNYLRDGCIATRIPILPGLDMP